MVDGPRTLREAIETLQRRVMDEYDPEWGNVRASFAEDVSATLTAALALPDAVPRRKYALPMLSLPPREVCGNGTATGIARTLLVRDQREEAVKAGRNFLAAVRGLPWGQGGGVLWPATRVGVSVLAFRHPLWSARKLDDDNLWRGLKATLDGLAEAGLVGNDRQFYMAGKVEWRVVGYVSEAGVQLTLTPDHEGGDEQASGDRVNGGDAAHAGADRS